MLWHCMCKLNLTILFFNTIEVLFKKIKIIPMNLAWLVVILHIIYRSRGSNSGHHISPHLKCVSSSH